MPPSVNACYATVGGRRIRTRALNQFRAEIEAYALRNRALIRPIQEWLAEELERHKVIVINAHFFFNRERVLCKDGTTPKRLDTSNFLKACHDGVSEILSIDDKYFWDGTFTKNTLGVGDSKESVTVMLETRHL